MGIYYPQLDQPPRSAHANTYGRRQGCGALLEYWPCGKAGYGPSGTSQKRGRRARACVSVAGKARVQRLGRRAPGEVRPLVGLGEVQFPSLSSSSSDGGFVEMYIHSFLSRCGHTTSAISKEMQVE